jgi:hypothetical protein
MTLDKATRSRLIVALVIPSAVRARGTADRHFKTGKTDGNAGDDEKIEGLTSELGAEAATGMAARVLDCGEYSEAIEACAKELVARRRSARADVARYFATRRKRSVLRQQAVHYPIAELIWSHAESELALFQGNATLRCTGVRRAGGLDTDVSSSNDRNHL